MSVQKIQKEDYRTNRADYLIAKTPIVKAEPRPKKRSSRQDDQRTARLSENPFESRSRPRH